MPTVTFNSQPEIIFISPVQLPRTPTDAKERQELKPLDPESARQVAKMLAASLRKAKARNGDDDDDDVTTVKPDQETQVVLTPKIRTIKKRQPRQIDAALAKKYGLPASASGHGDEVVSAKGDQENQVVSTPKIRVIKKRQPLKIDATLAKKYGLPASSSHH